MGSRTPRIWRRSLQFRTVVSTVVVTFVVIGIAGVVLMQLVSAGLTEAKQLNAQAEAAAGRSIARGYAATTIETDNDRIIDNLVSDLAARAGKPPSYDVIVQSAPEAAHLPSHSTELVSMDSVPPELTQVVRGEQRQAWMYVDIAYTDGRVEPGLVVGAPVNIRGIGPYELYYLFTLDDVTRTITIVRSTVLAVGLVLVLALGAIAWWTSSLLVRPVQQASRTAAALATGDLSRRIPVRGEDDMARLAASFNTMADSLQTQIVRLRELSEMQRRFVADVSHELRTPLTTIRMAADVINTDVDAGTPLSARTTELLLAEVERFEALLSDLLEVSRFDAGEVVLEEEEVDIAFRVREWVGPLAGVASEHGCELVVTGAGACPVSCDPRRIGRVVRNLVVNAIEYGAGHPVEVNVHCTPDQVAVSVTDHGVGVDPENAERVFQRFWRADPARTRTLGGTGLGLAISREDARLHGGDLTVKGSRGEGSTFTLTLPRQRFGSAAAELADDPLSAAGEPY